MTTLPFRPPCTTCRGRGFTCDLPCLQCNGKGFTDESGRTHRSYSEADIVTERVTVECKFDNRMMEYQHWFWRERMRGWCWAMVVCAAFWVLVAFITWLILKD